MKVLILAGLLSLGLAPQAMALDLDITANAAIAEMRPGPDRGSYFDWGTSRGGFGYCYEWTFDGQVLNGGQPVSNYSCEARRPSMFLWNQGRNGFGYCYQYTPYRVPMNEGQPQSNYSCESRHPSRYGWGRSRDGYTRCYQWTPNGYVMNDGQPVSDYMCRR